MATINRPQPPWQAPPPPGPDAQLPPLRIWNSLTRSKTPFVPIDWKNKAVTFYSCGPTVYDDAHLGHARNYVTTDIVRRILRDYFHYNVKFVMNITDIDDKIILRGRQKYILEEFRSRNASSEKTAMATSQAALQAYLAKHLPLVPSETRVEELKVIVEKNYGQVLSGKALGAGSPGDIEAKIKMHVKIVLAAAGALERAAAGSFKPLDLYTEAQDILLPYLDTLHKSMIDGNNHSIFTKLTQKYEARFMEDVRALNCIDPDKVTRVTEYGKCIVDFVAKIEKNGYAYATSDGSVYFDIEAFEAENHSYARLEPWNRDNKALLADGEGALTSKSTEKRSPAHFVLWKASKEGEPSWPSPWGRGRPGWHIECSAMASDVLGGRIDIHSGGIDLAFPHHDNELAQSEAFWTDKTNNHQQHQWVNYFMHMGHLSIAGSKMSKSLKNFTTIREALSQGWTPRGLRIVFLMGSWKDGIEITDDVVKQGSAWEEKLNNFFLNVNDFLDRGQRLPDSTVTREVEAGLAQALEKAQKDTDDALCDSFSTAPVMTSISETISAFNSVDTSAVAVETIRKTAKWITSMVNTFGLNGNASHDSEIIGWSGLAISDAARPFVYPLSEVRDGLRKTARAAGGVHPADLSIVDSLKKLKSAAAKEDHDPYVKVTEVFTRDIEALSNSVELSKDVLQLCDKLRDVDLWNLGIYLEDREGNQPALVRPITKELLAAREEKYQREQQKLKAKEDRIREAAAKADKGRLSHLDMFRTTEYSAWDGDGIPTKDEEGKEVAKSKSKKLKKMWDAQKKSHEAWLKEHRI